MVRVVYLAPGTGGTYYCQNCMRDAALVRALRAQGHDVIMAPMYLPILVDAENLTGDVPVFFGGINVYLQQKLGLFRKTPRWLDRWLDTPRMLGFAARREGSTEPAHLGPMTLSMLDGPQGHQKKELDRLLDWLVEHEKPDIVHLSNALLVGVASEIKQRLGVPIVCSLQDEENWLDGIDAPYDQRCWDAMSARSKEIDAFIVVSGWYAQEMQARMQLRDAMLRVVPLGIDLDERDPAELPADPPVLGYLSKMTEALGLGALVDAFITLKQDPQLKHLKLRATGGQHGPDREFIGKLRHKLDAHGYLGDVAFLEGFDLAERRNFLRGLTVLSVPAPRGEAFGMYIIEALAEGVPVVQPRVGGYPEVIAQTGGGILFDQADPEAYVAALASLLKDPVRARTLGLEGRDKVRRDFGVKNMAEGVANVYQSLL